MAKKSHDDDETPPIYGGMTVWVFMGASGTNPMGIWSSLDAAHKYIHDEQLSGSLTAFGIDQPVYDWAIKTGRFKPKGDQHKSLKFRQTFSNQHQEHYTFREGRCDALGTPRHFEDVE